MEEIKKPVTPTPVQTTHVDSKPTEHKPATPEDK
jgi:hypothetical protein